MELIYVGLNGRVSAIDRNTGQIVWFWQSPKPSRGYVSILLEGDRIIAGISGYLYCLEAASGKLMWENPMRGFGYGIFSIASVRGNSNSSAAAQRLAEDAAAAAAASASGAAG